MKRNEAMEQYISKAALVAEIENLENTYKKCPTRNTYEDGLKNGRLIGYKDTLYTINKLEVKEEPELTVDDIMKLDALLINMWQSKSPNKYEEVLKQFKAQKGE